MLTPTRWIGLGYGFGVEQFRSIVVVLKQLSDISTLVVNLSKTQIVLFTQKTFQENQIRKMENFRCDIVQKVKLLRKHFQNNLEPAFLHSNYTKQLENICRNLFLWFRFNLSLTNKEDIIKIFALSKQTMLLPLYPNPPIKSHTPSKPPYTDS